MLTKSPDDWICINYTVEKMDTLGENLKRRSSLQYLSSNKTGELSRIVPWFTSAKKNIRPFVPRGHNWLVSHGNNSGSSWLFLWPLNYVVIVVVIVISLVVKEMRSDSSFPFEECHVVSRRRYKSRALISILNGDDGTGYRSFSPSASLFLYIQNQWKN